MKLITAWFVLILGIVLILPLLGVNQLGTPTSGILGWILALVVLFLGIYHLIVNYKK